MRFLILAATASLTLSAAAHAQSPGTAQPTPEFQQGLSDRQSWETWFASLSGDYRIGAEYWSGQRSKPRPGSCLGASGETLGDVTAGCLAAQQRLAPVDARRKTEPDYRLGFNSYSPVTKPTAATTSTPPAVSAPSPPTLAGPTFTDKDIPMLLSHTDPNDFIDNFMGKSFMADGVFASFERVPIPADVTLFMVSVMTAHGQVVCFYDKESGVTAMPFTRGQSVVISGKLGIAIPDALGLEQGCSVISAHG
ncbi:MAG: hypothetical protein WBQ75_01120 [Acetobacteraceae bacterium]